MSEDEFWRRLELRVCRELAGMSEPSLRWLAFDGFDPWSYLDDGEPRIEGRAWFLDVRDIEWHFTLFLPRPFGSRDDIPWASLLPAEDVTRWLALDRLGRRLQIEPAAAVPDLA